MSLHSGLSFSLMAAELLCFNMVENYNCVFMTKKKKKNFEKEAYYLPGSAVTV